MGKTVDSLAEVRAVDTDLVNCAPTYTWSGKETGATLILE
jgi:hypothetical protein